MEAVNVHGEIESVVHSLDTVPSELVGFVNTFGVPIRPVQLILKESQSKGVWQSCNANTKVKKTMQYDPKALMVIKNPFHPSY